MEIAIDAFIFESSAEATNVSSPIFELPEGYAFDSFNAIAIYIVNRRIQHAFQHLAELIGEDVKIDDPTYSISTPPGGLIDGGVDLDGLQRRGEALPTGPQVQTIHYMIWFGDDLIRCDVTIGPSESGSFWQNYVLSFDNLSIKGIRDNVIAGLLITTITATCVFAYAQTQDEPGTYGDYYSCTVSAVVQGVRKDIEDDTIADLLMPEFASEHDVTRVTKNRQTCLAAAGFPPGPIDGIWGKKSAAAASDFSKFNQNIKVDWESPVFLRFLVQKSMKYQAK